jgi:Calcium binding
MTEEPNQIARRRRACRKARTESTKYFYTPHEELSKEANVRRIIHRIIEVAGAAPICKEDRMKTKKAFRQTKRLRPSKGRLSRAALDRLVEEAIVDCYNESEQAMGLYTMIEENLKVPFETEVLGVPVQVTGVDITEDDRVVAVCQRKGSRQRLPILELPLPTPRPAGSEWIDAYRHWARGG